MVSNLFLDQVNSSDHDFVIQSMARLAKGKVMWAVNIVTLIGLLVIFYTPINSFLKFEPLSAMQLLQSVGIAAAAVLLCN